MGKKRKGGRRGVLSRLKQKVATIAGGLVASIGAGHGLISAVGGVLGGGDPKNLPRDIVWNYSGVNVDDGSFNSGQALKSATIVLVTAGIGKLLVWVGRH